MNLPHLPSSWYALTVRTRYEAMAALGLRAKGLREFAPVYPVRRQWSDRVKQLALPLFPGYVFCRFSYAERMAVLNTSWVTSVVSLGKTPAAIPDDEIEAIQRAVASGLPLQPWPYLRAGQTVLITQGCLAGVSGTLLREPNAWRVIVSVELLQRSVAVEIDRALIRPAAIPHAIASCASGGLPCRS